MEHLWVALVQGIVEGLTEFLPVSSTGHLILSGDLLGFTGDKAATFEIVIQLGAILAVLLLYWKRVFRLFGLYEEPARNQVGPRQHITLIHVLIAILPALILGFILHGFIKSLFTPGVVLIGLVAGGIFMIYAEKRNTRIAAQEMDQLSYKMALKIGLFQCLSLWPGFSRSGATIAGGMLAGASIKASANFSFLIAIPVMFAASGYDMLKSYKSFSADDLTFLAVGFVVSFIVALLAVVSFLKLLQVVRLTHFAIYRFILAAAFALWMFAL